MAKTLLFHVSDIHFGLENNEALDWFSAEVTRLRPAAIAITGDLTMRARHHEFRAAEEWIGTLDAPVTLAPGATSSPGHDTNMKSASGSPSATLKTCEV